MTIKFTNLHGHDSFSFFDGYSAPEEYCKHNIKNAGEDSGGFAITNHGSMNSIGYMVAAQKKYKEKGQKIIYGNEFYYIPSLKDWSELKKQRAEEKEEQSTVIEDEKESKQVSKWKDPINRRNHLVINAINKKGLENLFLLTSKSYKFGFYRKPRIDLEMLREHNEGLIATTACISGIPAFNSLLEDDLSDEQIYKKYDNDLLPLLAIFGRERAFLELQFNKLPSQKTLNRHLVEYSKRSGYGLVATCDCHYPSKEMWRAREILILLGRQQQGKEIDRSIIDKTVDQLECELFLKNGDEMLQAFRSSPSAQDFDESVALDAITKTYDINQNLIEWVEPDSTPKFPRLNKVTTEPSIETLQKLCVKAMEEKGLSEKDEYIDRLGVELETIKQKNVADYFLCVKEICDHLRQHMLIGPGRGSGSGSIVVYLLNISQVDPLKHNLIWERFYGKSRADLPDLDVDFSHKEDAIRLLKEKFGEDNVLYVSNYNKLNLKSLIKDISKLFNVPFQEVNAVTMAIEHEAKKKILNEINNDQKLYELSYEKAKQHSPTLQKFLINHPEVDEHIVSLYRENKSIGRHASACLVLDDAWKHLPVIYIKGEAQCPITEGITAQHLSSFGLIKIDILGLNTLRVIKRCIEKILLKDGNVAPSMQDVWEWYNKHLHPDIVAQGEPDVFDNVYCGGKFCATFQFTQQKVKDFSVASKLSSIIEVSQATSIQRPGPLSNKVDEKYIEAKQSAEEVSDRMSQEHAVIQQVLGENYGYIFFQEDFMNIAHKLAGFTLEETDTLRKLIMKPSHEMKGEIVAQRDRFRTKFIEGCMNNGLDEERAIHLWDVEIIPFASYSFNKSHSVDYAYISYQCAHLLTRHEQEWVLSCLDLDEDREAILDEVKSLGYTIAPVDIINSTQEWTINAASRTLYPPLSAIKGLGDVAAQELFLRRSQWQETLSSRDTPMTEKEIFDQFFFNQELVQLKKSSKIKKVWHFSKFNKRNIEMLAKTDSLNGLGIIGADKLFKNHAHFWRTIEDNWSKKESFDIEAAAKLANDKDWANSEKILFQFEILGTVPPDLVLAPEELDVIESRLNNIRGLADEDLNREAAKYWFVLTDFEVKTTGSGKKYFKLSIGNLKETNLQFNYFMMEPREKFERFGVYVADLLSDGQWLNVPKNSYIDRLK